MSTPFDDPTSTTDPSPTKLSTLEERLKKATEILEAVAQNRQHARGCDGSHYAWDPISGDCQCHVVLAMLFVGAKRKETGDA